MTAAQCQSIGGELGGENNARGVMPRSEDVGSGRKRAERQRVAEVSEQRAARRRFLCSPPTPRAPDEPGYRDVYATEARTPGEAAAKVRPLGEGRRLRTYLATGTYKDELAEARWVA
jgi:hypothetical protein